MSGSVDVGTLRAKLGLDASQFDKGLAKAKGDIKSLGSAMTEFAGPLLGMAAGFGIFEQFKTFTRDGMEFAHTMETVGGVFRATQEEIEGVKEAAVRFSEASSYTAQQIGRGFYYLASAGFSATEAIKAMPTVLDLAKIGEMDIARATDVAVNAMRGMGLGVEDLGRIADVSVGTFTRMNSTLDTLAESYTYVIPIGHAMGYTFEEINALLGVLSNAGVKGSIAGTQLSMAMERANEIALKLGLSSSDLVDVLEEMREKGYNTADVMKMFGIRAGRAALILWDNTKAARALADTLQTVGGEAEVLGKRMEESAKSSLGRLRGMWASVGEAVYSGYEKELINVIEKTTQWLSDNRDGIAAFLGTLMQAIVEIVSALSDLGRVVAEVISGVADAMGVVRGDGIDAVESINQTAKEFAESFQPPAMSDWDKFYATVKMGFHGLFIELTAFIGVKMIYISSMVRQVGQLIMNLARLLVSLGAQASAVLDIAATSGSPKAWAGLLVAQQNTEKIWKKLLADHKKIKSERDSAAEALVGRSADAFDNIQSPQQVWDTAHARSQLRQFLDLYRKENESLATDLMAENDVVNKKFSKDDKAALEYRTLLWTNYEQTRRDTMAEELRLGQTNFHMTLKEVSDMGVALDKQLEKQRRIFFAGTDYHKNVVPGKGGPDSKGDSAAKDRDKAQADIQAGLKTLLTSNTLTAAELDEVWKVYYQGEQAKAGAWAARTVAAGGDVVRATQIYNDKIAALMEKKPGYEKPAKKLTDAQQKKADDAAVKKAVKTAKDVRDAQESAYQEMMQSGMLTSQQMASTWKEYKEIRLKQIDEELIALQKKDALSQDDIDRLRKIRIKALENENVQAAARKESWVRIADDGFASIADATARFMTTQKGEWADFHRFLRDMLTNFVADVLHNLVNQASPKKTMGSSVVDATGKVISWIGGVFGHRGTNVSPNAPSMNDLNTSDKSYISRLAPEGSSVRSSRAVTVVIQTPNPQSFRASSSQIATRLGLAVRQADRRF